MVLAMGSLAGAALAQAPQFSDVKVETFFSVIRPGDEYVVTLEAKREGGLSDLNAFVTHSVYVGGNNEIMNHLTFKPTGRPDEFQCRFIVPSHQEGKPEAPLPKGRYRMEMTSGHDGNGAGFGHPYVVLLVLSFDPEPGPPWEARITGPSIVHGGLPPQLDFAAATRGTETTLDYRCTVKDYYGAPVGEAVVGRVDLKKDELLPKTLELPFAADAGQYRVTLALTDRNSDHAVQLNRRLLPEKTAGLRRELILEDAQWEHLPVSELTDETPADDAKWRSGPKRWGGLWVGGGLNWPTFFEKDTVAVWLRCSFEAPAWLTGDRFELYFGELGFLATVYLNGQPLHKPTAGPNIPLTVDATAAFRPGQPNILHIRLEDERPTLTPKGEGLAYGGRTVWPRSAIWGGMGCFQEVRLRTYPKASVSDLFVIPSVTDSQLGLRVDLRNDGDKARKLQLAHEVVDASGKVVLKIAPKPVDLAAGKSSTIEQTQPWADPILWWHDAPYLYRLRTLLLDKEGEPVDQFDTRFGFREFRADGIHLQFNGRRLKSRLFSQVGHINSFEGWSTSLINWRNAAEKAGHAGPHYERMHLIIPNRALLDAADELGILLEIEAPLGSLVTNTSKQETWDNYAGMIERMFRRDKNRPSVVVWSIDNEVLICTNTAPTCYGINQQGLVNIARQLQTLDPTRLIVSNGGGDIDGTWNTINLHYPRSWFNWHDLPNSAFWLKFGKRDMPTSSDLWPYRVNWDSPKPIFLGESGLYVTAEVPHDMASLAGDAGYRTMFDAGGDRWSLRSVDDQANAMHVEGFRDSEVAMPSTVLGGTGGAASDLAHIPVRSFVRQRDRTFFGGDTVTRNVNLHHDLMKPAKVTFAWTLSADGNVIAGREQTWSMVPGELKRLIIELPIPEVAKLTPLKFEHRVLRDDKQMFSEVIDYSAFPRKKISIDRPGALGVLDSAGKTVIALKQHDLEFVQLDTLDAGANQKLSDLRCLIIGQGSLDEADAEPVRSSLLPFARDGGVVICLQQKKEALQGWVPLEGLKAHAGRQTTISWPRAPHHPVLSGITTSMLRWWRGDNIVSRHDLRKPTTWGYRTLVDSAGRGGMRWTSVVEVPHGRGAIVLCQMNLIDKLDVEPVAHLLLQNLLTYGVTRKPQELDAIHLAAEPEGPLRKRLDALGVPFSDDTQSPVLIADAGAAELGADQVKAHLDAGKTVLLVGLTEANLSNWASLLPDDAKLEKTDALFAAGKHDHPLLAGVSPTALWWAECTQWSQEQKGGIAIEYALRTGSDSTELVESGGLTLLPVGKGQLLIDQMRWYADDVHDERSGQYIVGLLMNLAAGG